MNPRPRLVIPQQHHNLLRSHLFPGDGKEAAALMFCAQGVHGDARYLVQDICVIPHEACGLRARDQLRWPGSYVEAAIDAAETTGASILAIHSHPGDYFAFSAADDRSDRILVPALQQANRALHGTAIMVPDGAVRARLYTPDLDIVPFAQVMMPGDDIRIWWHDDENRALPIAFTAQTRPWLKRLSVAVIGVSGTGSIVAEQLARLGFGRIILIDFDVVEERNLNRILYATVADAQQATPKIEVLARAIQSHHPDTEVVVVKASIADKGSVIAASGADVLFSCVDTAEGRHMADRLASYFAIPLFDVGVSIPTLGKPAAVRRIAEVCGRIDYVYPGGATLKDRGVYDSALLEAEYLRQAAPAAYAQRVTEGYIRGLAEQAPSVITLNMRAAADCVMELIARLFPFRHDGNGKYARTIFMLADGDTEYFPERDFMRTGELPVAVGATAPLLGLPSLGVVAKEAA